MRFNSTVYADAIHHSFYAQSKNIALDLTPLTDNLSCDVCVVGGGLTGIVTALNLAELGYEVVLLEANSELASQASGVNGGQVLNSYECGMDYLASKYGNTNATELWNLSLNAVNLVKNNIAKYNLSCDWQDGCGIVAYKARHLDFLKSEYALMHKQYKYDGLELYSAKDITNIVGSEIYHGCLYDCNAGHMHPLNYALGLAKVLQSYANAKIYIQSRVDSIIFSDNRHLIKVANKLISAKYVVLACNYQNGMIIPSLARNVSKFETYMLATEPLTDRVANGLIKNNMAVFDSRNVMNYYRLSADNCLLFGGGDTFGAHNIDKVKKSLYLDMLKVFPQLDGVRVQNFWSGADSLTLNLVPDIGQLANNLYYAQGYSGQGLALSNLAGQIIANAIHGNSTSLDLFNELKPLVIGGNPLLNTVFIKLGLYYFRLKDYFL